MANILIVEDERISAEDAAAAVRGAGHEVVGIAARGESAMEMAERLHPDLALVDIGLRGEMNGITVADRLRRELGVAVVFVTAHADPAVFERARDTLPFGYILKPFEERTLQRCVDVALGRLRAYRAVLEHGSWLSTLLRSIGVAVVATDEIGTIRFSNPEADALFGLEPLTGKLASSTLSFVQADGGAFDPVSSALRAAGPVELPSGTTLRTRDGRRVAVEGSAAILRDDLGQTQGVVLAFRDVSERLEMERERRRAERLEALGTLAAGVAHDFNNLLAIIMNDASLARLAASSAPRVAGPSVAGPSVAGPSVAGAARVAELMNDIELCAARAQALTAELMAFSKGGASSPRPVGLGPLLGRSVDQALRGSPIECRYEADDALRPVHVDESQMALVFTNLALHAREATAGAGVIEVGARNRTLGAGEDPLLDPGEYLEVRVADRGPGIPEESLARLFDPYFGEKPGAASLGLAAAYGIVRRHGGNIRVESRANRGTAFFVLLPASAEAAPVIAEQPSATVVVHAGRRVLVMDDEEGLRMVLSRLLEELGYEVESAPNGERAVALYESALRSGRRFDLVILDLTVRSGMGGVEALAQLAGLDPAVRAVASSGYSESDVLSNHRTYGFKAALPKPYTFAALTQALEQALGAGEKEEA